MTERWFKQSSQAAHDPKWRTIAAHANATIPEAFVAFEVGEAWSAEHGGSLAGFDLEVEAAALDIPLDRFKRIWSALVAKGLAIIEAMIDDVRVAAGRLTAWAKRQARSPAESPPAAAAVRTRGPRQRREGDKGERRPDQSRTEQGVAPLPPAAAPPSGDPAEPTLFDRAIGLAEEAAPAPIARRGSRVAGTNPRASGTAPRAAGTNPRAYQRSFALPISGGADVCAAPGGIAPLMAGTSPRALAVAGCFDTSQVVINGGADVDYARPARRRHREPTAREALSAACADWAAALGGTDIWRVHRGAGPGLASAGG